MRSLTALNTMVDVDGFRRPWSMHPFSVRGLGEVWLRSLNRWAFSEIFYLQGVGDRAAVPRNEVFAHYDLLKRGDRGRAFLRIMRGFELTAEKEAFFRAGLAARSWPAQVVWGADDPALGRKHMRRVAEALTVTPVELRAKHFLPEDRAPEIADAVAAIAGRGETTTRERPDLGKGPGPFPNCVTDPLQVGAGGRPWGSGWARRARDTGSRGCRSRGGPPRRGTPRGPPRRRR